MSKSTAKKSIYNILSSTLGQVLAILFGLYIPRLVLVNLGSEPNGLLNSANQILTYLALLEAGVGNATVQALYGPIARGNVDAANGILSATNRYYKKTGLLYVLCIFIIGLVYPVVVPSQLDYMTILSVIVLTGLPNAINFYFQGKYKLLLQVDGRNYVITNLTMFVNIGTSMGKVVLLTFGFGVISLQILFLLFSLFQLIVIKLYIKKVYKWIDLNVTPDTAALSQKNSVMVHQVSGLVFSSTDMFILSVGCGLKIVSVYSMYSLIFGMINTMIQNLNNSIIFIMGQKFNTDRKFFLKLHNTYETYNMALSFSFYGVAGIFIIPFLRLYTSGVNDISYIDNKLPILFILIYVLDAGRIASAKAITIAGHFKETQWHAIVETIINLSVSVLGVIYYGIYGVLFGTIAALVFRTNIMIYYAAKKILNISPLRTYKKWIGNIILLVVLYALFSSTFSFVNNYFLLFIYALLFFIAVLLVFLIFNSLIEKEAFVFGRELFLNVCKKKIRKRPGVEID